MNPEALAEALSDYTGATPLEHQRHEDFAQFYVHSTGGNGAKAARMAGYSENQGVAAVEASRLLNKPNVSKRIKYLQQRRYEQLQVTDAELLWRASAVVRADPRKMFNEAGQLLSLPEMDDETAAAIAGFEVDEIVAGDVVIGTAKKVKLRDSHAAMRTLLQVRKLLGADNSTTFNFNLAQRMERARKRVPKA
jgi:phage terminase small subunit